MSEEQIQDIAMGVVAAAIESQSQMMPVMREQSMPMEMMPPPDMGQMPPEMPQQGMPQ